MAYEGKMCGNSRVELEKNVFLVDKTVLHLLAFCQNTISQIYLFIFQLFIPVIPTWEGEK